MLRLKSSLLVAGAAGLAGLLVLPFVAMGDDVGSAVVNGKVNFKGEKPKKAKINMSGVPECAELHGEETVFDPKVTVNDNGTLANVFVYVSKGLEGKKFTAPEAPVVLDQKGCMYSPHVFGIMVGQKLQITNSDPLMHNIHALGTKNAEFNFAQIAKAKAKMQTFSEIECAPPVMFKCEVHGWMGCYGAVLPHPFYSVSSDQGAFELKGLPAGEYEVTAWHEQYGEQKQTVKVGDKETKSVEFTFEAK